MAREVMMAGIDVSKVKWKVANPDPESMKKRVKQIVYEKLKKKLKETYCREGFIKLDNLFVRGKHK